MRAGFEVLCGSLDSNFIDFFSIRTSSLQKCVFSGNPQEYLCVHMANAKE